MDGDGEERHCHLLTECAPVRDDITFNKLLILLKSALLYHQLVVSIK